MSKKSDRQQIRLCREYLANIASTTREIRDHLWKEKVDRVLSRQSELNEKLGDEVMKRRCQLEMATRDLAALESSAADDGAEAEARALEELEEADAPVTLEEIHALCDAMKMQYSIESFRTEKGLGVEIEIKEPGGISASHDGETATKALTLMRKVIEGIEIKRGLRREDG